MKLSLLKSLSLKKMLRIGGRPTPEVQGRSPTASDPTLPKNKTDLEVEPADTLPDQLEAAKQLLAQRAEEITVLRRQVTIEKANKAMIAQELYATMKQSDSQCEEMDRMTDEIEDLHEQLVTNANREASTGRSFELLRAEVAAWEKVLTAACNALREENTCHREEYEAAMFEMGQLHEQVRGLKNEISDWETTDAQLEAERDALKAENIKAALKYSHAMLQNSEIRNTLMELVDMANTAFDTLERRLKASKARNAAVRARSGDQIRGLMIEKEELEETVRGLDYSLRVATANWYQERYRRFTDGDFQFDGHYWR